MYKKISLFIFYLLSSVTLPQISYATQVRYYDIEVVIFENLDENARISEAWPHLANYEPVKPSVTIGQPYPGPMPRKYLPNWTFKPLADNLYHLKTEAKLLAESNKYRILKHIAWRQPGMPAEMALPVEIHENMVATPVTTTNIATHASTTTGTATAALDGQIKIHLSRYLHADVDLQYRVAMPQTTLITDTDDAETTTAAGRPSADISEYIYRLKQSRRMRSGEVHYIDHPVLGVLVLASPVKNR